MIRSIDGFTVDEQGDWVASLSCLHRQHVRHAPPFRDRAWVTSAAGRDGHLGAPLDCPLCDRAEPPAGLRASRTAGPFDAGTLPAGLRRTHRVAERTWARLRVLEGVVRLTMATAPPIDVVLRAGEEHHIPPGVDHILDLQGPFRLAVDFLVADSATIEEGRWPTV